MLIKLPESPWQSPGLPNVKNNIVPVWNYSTCLKCLECLGFCKVLLYIIFTFLCYCNLSYYAHTLIIKKAIKNIIIQYKIVLRNLVILGILGILGIYSPYVSIYAIASVQHTNVSHFYRCWTYLRQGSLWTILKIFQLCSASYTQQ